MKKALDRLTQSAIHLQAIEDFFMASVAEYAGNEEKLERLGQYYQQFARELYAGGRKDGRRDTGSRFHRGMILADLLTYAVFGRGYYMATATEEHRKAFIQIVMRIANKLLIQENISTDPGLRRGLLEAVLSGELQNLFEDDDQKRRFERLRDYDGPIIWGHEGQEHYSTMDSHLPKSRGLAIEFLIYLYLIHRRFGFVIPLLLHQRLLIRGDSIAPPDFLILKRDGRLFGVEVGFLKEGQSTEFVARTSIPTIAAELDNDQPFRCPECQQWIIYCDRVVQSYSEGISSPNPLPCAGCEYYNNGRCPDIILLGEDPDVGSGERRYHYRCVLKKGWVRKLASANRLKDKQMVWFPTASIIDSLSDEG